MTIFEKYDADYINERIEQFRYHKGQARKFQQLGKNFLMLGDKAKAREAARKMLAEKFLADQIEKEFGETISE